MSRYLRPEGALREAAWRELPAYALTNEATEALAWTLERAGFEAPEDQASPPASYWRAKALLYLGVLAVRTTRAAMAVVASGYEGEAMTYKRGLMEIHSRVRRVVGDSSGGYAREWLRNRAGKPAKAVGGYAPDGLWNMLSHSSHADHRAVENFLAISQTDGSTTLLTMPERRIDVSDATLAMCASETRDIAAAIAHEHNVEIPSLGALDALLKAHPALRDDGEPTARSTRSTS